MSYRANKSGYAAEAQKKTKAKYNEDEAKKCVCWMKMVAPAIEEIHENPEMTDCSAKGFHELLKDGIVLCKLIEELMPGKINFQSKTFQTPKIEAMKIMRERERISLFTTQAQEYGVADTYTFPTESLHEWPVADLSQVCACIRGLGIEAQDKGVGPENYWPKKTQKNVRNFSEEQLKRGSQVISLQYGSNQGASQAGMTMGKQRMILD